MSDHDKACALTFIIVNAIFWLAAVGAVTILASLLTLATRLIA